MKISTSLVIVVVAALGIWALFNLDVTDNPTATSSPTVSQSVSPSPSATLDYSDLIQVTSPMANATVKSPLIVTGKARGTWYFEASFPVKIYDGYGRLLGQTPAQAQTDWMTTDFVQFKATLTYDTPSTETGTLVLEKDNPSGLPANDARIVIPIKFDLTAVPKQTVKLYYYNSDKDKDASGNILCSAQGLVSVQRQVPSTKTPLQDTIRLLLRGELSAAEKAQGITTGFPLPGLELTSASITNGKATLTFKDSQNKTVGGSCRVGVLWAQIEATAKQFNGVTVVKFIPEELFQP